MSRPATTSVLRGDDSGATRVYATRNGNKVFQSTSLPEVIAFRRKHNLEVSADPAGVLFLLHNSLVPAPRTAYTGIYVLGMGDRLDLSTPLPVFQTEFPYYQHLSTGKSKPSTAKLLQLLCNSVEESVGKSGALMMSSGKDSVSLAVALNETGKTKGVEAFTYADATQPSDEASDAAIFARKLGLKHHTMIFPTDPRKVEEAMLNFFANASSPSCDPTTIPYAVCLYHAGVQNTQIIDGTRNDTYMGIVPSPDYQKLCRYYEMMGGGFTGLKSLRALIPYYHKANKFLSTYPEVNLYKHGHFRQPETSRFFQTPVNTENFWLNLYRTNKHLSMVDLRTLVIGQYFDGCSVVLKGATVAESMNSECVLPWAHQPLANYYFNLPEAHRYNKATLINKLLVREMLQEKIGYDSAAIGKRIFYFDMQNFVVKNMAFIRREILACTLWQPAMESELARYLNLVQTQPRAAGAIMDLFMVSGWHNHSKFLRA